MKAKLQPSPFSETMKLAVLIDQHPDLLALLTRMGIAPGFGEATVAEACRRSRVDVSTFLLACSVYTLPRFSPAPAVLREIHLEDLLRYLRSSHSYYVGTSLVALENGLTKLLEPAPEAKRKIIRGFYLDYKSDLEKHFDFEESVVFPYVDALVRGERPRSGNYGLDDEDHTHIDEKIQDLKNIVLKYLPEECDRTAAATLLSHIYALAADLQHHSAVEEKLLDPVIQEGGRSGSRYADIEDEDSRSELSAREKDILICVAQGMLNKEIADRFNLSIHTVITHRKNITRKTGIKTVAGLTVYALLNGLIDMSSVE